MNLTLHSLKKRLDTLNLNVEVLGAIEDTKDDVKKFNTKQLNKGIKSDQSDITPFYSPMTVLYKDQKGQPSDRVTLKDTGDFHNSIFVDVKTDTFEIFASDYKTNKLVEKYGEKIFGLTSYNKSQYIQYSFFPELRDRIQKKLGIKFG